MRRDARGRGDVCGAETDRRSRRPFSDRNRLARLWRGADLARDFPREAAAQSAVLTFPREPGTQQAIDVALTHPKTRDLRAARKTSARGRLNFYIPKIYNQTKRFILSHTARKLIWTVV